MTHMKNAQRGIATDEVKLSARREGIQLRKLLRSLADGSTVIVGKGEKAIPIGALASTKVNANIGTSHEFQEIGKEKSKLDAAIDAGADTVMDLSMASQEAA
ncbi:MAG: phosphomethylpyrimidine synthase ThiC, partial [Candidatus Micrarchaeota archaeon]